MPTLATLVVKIKAHNSDFRRTMRQTERDAMKTGKTFKALNAQVGQLTSGWMGGAAALGLIAYGLRQAAVAADEFDAAQRRLEGASKITGTSLAFMKGVASEARSEFKLSSAAANDMTVEMTKLAAKAGQLDQASNAMRSFLEIGAARGMNAQQTLEAVRQAILGIDEGTDKLFNANPSVLYERYAEMIGVSAAKLTDQQKAQALLNAALTDGNKVLGSYNSFLESSAGKAATAAMRTEEAAARLGKALSHIRDRGNEMRAFWAEAFGRLIARVQMFGARLGFLFEGFPNIVKRALGQVLHETADFVRQMNNLLPEPLQFDIVDSALASVSRRGLEMMHAANMALRPLKEALASVEEDILRDMGFLSTPGAAAAGGQTAERGPFAGIAAPVVKLVDSTNQASIAIEYMAGRIQEAKKRGDALADVGRSIVFAFGDALSGALTDARSAFRAFVEYAIQQLLRLAAQFAVFKALSAVFPGSGFVQGIGNALGFANATPAPAAPAPASVGGAPLALNVNVGPPRTPFDVARDEDWQRALAMSVQELKAKGFAF